MFRQFRKIERGEFFVVSADCSQGGLDYNACIFMSKTNLDVPLLYHARGTANSMTSRVHLILEWIYDRTGIKPVVAYETAMGGSSEMERLHLLNRMGKYVIFEMPTIGKVESGKTGRMGYITSSATRPILLGDWKTAIDGKLVRLYDERTVKEHYDFIINDRTGKPEAGRNKHDDLVMAHAIAWQLYQQCQPTTAIDYSQIPTYKPIDSKIGI